jgi:hypothetical protein
MGRSVRYTGIPASVYCRIWHAEVGQSGSAPSVAALQLALQQATELPAAVLPDPAAWPGLGRLAPVEAGLCVIHQRLLRHLGETVSQNPRWSLALRFCRDHVCDQPLSA